MVLEQLALLGIAGLDAYLLSQYLSSRKQAAERAKALSYQSPRLARAESAGAATAAPLPEAGETVVLSDRLSAIKDAVGQTKFADEVLPYEIGALPTASPLAEAEGQEAAEETVSDFAVVPEAAGETAAAGEAAAFPAAERDASLNDAVKSHEGRIQGLSADLAVLEYRIAEVERMLGVEKAAAQEQKPEQLEIPLKPIVVQPVVVEKRVLSARRRKKKAAAKKKARAARKGAAARQRKAVRKAEIVKPKKAAVKKPAKRKAGKHVSKARKPATSRVEVVIKSQAAKRRKPKARRKAKKTRKSRVEVVIRNAAAKKRRKPRRKRAPKKSRVEVVVRAARGTVVKKARKSGSKVEVVVAGKKKPARKAKAGKRPPERKKAAKKSRSSAPSKVEVVVTPASAPKQKPAEKKQEPPGAKDHMDIEWKGSKIKLYSGDSKD
jgi:hypothetical protein